MANIDDEEKMRKALERSKGEGRSGGREVSHGGWGQVGAEVRAENNLRLLERGANPAYLTLVCRCTYRLWKLLVLSVRPKLGPCSLWMISAFITRAM